VVFWTECNCSVEGTRNVTLPGVLYLDCIRDDTVVPTHPGMVSYDNEVKKKTKRKSIKYQIPSLNSTGKIILA